MAGVFGGDSSVMWKVDAKRVRETKVVAKGKIHRHEVLMRPPEAGLRSGSKFRQTRTSERGSSDNWKIS